MEKIERVGKIMVHIGLLLIIVPSIIAAWYIFFGSGVDSSPPALWGLGLLIYVTFVYGWWIMLTLLVVSFGLIVGGIFLIVSSKNPENPHT